MIDRRKFIVIAAAVASAACRDVGYYYDWTTNPVTTDCPNPLALRRGQSNTLLCNGQDMSERLIVRAKCGPNGWFEILRLDLFKPEMDEIPKQMFHGNVQVKHKEVV